MKFSRYSYIAMAAVFILLVSAASYFLGTINSGKPASDVSSEPTVTNVPTVIINAQESSISATPKEATPSVTGSLKISIMPKISLILKISPTVTPTPTSKLIFNPNLKKVVLLPTATPTPKAILKISPVKQIGI